MPVRKKEKPQSAAERLRAHIERIQGDPNHDRQIVAALYERLGRMTAGREDEEDLINKLQKRNKALQRISGRQ